LCSTNCAGDSSEKCGASSYQNVFDLSTVVGTICPSNVLAELGSLCCPERASFRFLDYTFFNLLVFLIYLFSLFLFLTFLFYFTLFRLIYSRNQLIFQNFQLEMAN